MPPLPAQRSDLNRSFLNFPATPGQRTSLECPCYCWWKVFSFQQTGSECVEDGLPFQTRTLSLFLMVVLFHFVWTRELDYYSMTGGEQRSAKALRPCAHWMYIWTAPTSLTNLKMALLGWRDDSWLIILVALAEQDWLDSFHCPLHRNFLGAKESSQCFEKELLCFYRIKPWALYSKLRQAAWLSTTWANWEPLRSLKTRDWNWRCLLQQERKEHCAVGPITPVLNKWGRRGLRPASNI